MSFSRHRVGLVLAEKGEYGCDSSVDGGVVGGRLVTAVSLATVRRKPPRRDADSLQLQDGFGNLQTRLRVKTPTELVPSRADVESRRLRVGVEEPLQLESPYQVHDGTSFIENPSDLNDEYALVESSQAGTPESVTILVSGSQDQLQSFRPPSGASVLAVARPGNEDVLAAVGALTVACVVLLLVSLVGAAGFVVIAQRRLRQLGMLAAIGATEKHLRLVMVANGVVIGGIAAIIGTSLAPLVWILVVPSLEDAVGHRIDRFDFLWWLIGTSMVLAVVTATAAAWWPARAVARTRSSRHCRAGRPTRNQHAAPPLGVPVVSCALID